MAAEPPHSDAPAGGRDFIRQMVDRDLAAGRYSGVVTRFPPEPNGYLHLGHAKSICLNFGLAAEYGGRCHLRFDDTNPLTEDEEYTRTIQEDVRWLGFDFGEHLYFASDYFGRMYEVARDLIRKGKAYVDSASEEEIREARGTVTRSGVPTPDRDRPVEESLELFGRMRAGEFPDGTLVLRGRIDLASPNMLMRDPIFYRIRHAHHYRTGDDWCIYPLYDFAHCLEDAFEEVTHSLCTLEFENNRELYDWILEEAGFREPRPHQTEFARLNLDYTVLSKRKLIRLVRDGHVTGWDDPRMPTIAGIRRRGVPPSAVRRFADLVGVARADSRVDVDKLDFAIREEMNATAPRLMAVLEPLRVVLTNVDEGWSHPLDAPLFPDDGPARGTRRLTVTRDLYIDRDDFSEDPPRGWKRLAPGGSVRLRHGFVVRCDEVVRDPVTGAPTELRCSVDPASLDGPGEGWKVSGAIHWVSAAGAVPAEVRLYDRLFTVPDPDDVPEEGDFTQHLNPDSLRILEGAMVEPAWSDPAVGPRVQFERLGFFALDPDATADRPVFNRVVTLRDGWARRGRTTGRGAEGAGEGRGSRSPSGRRVPQAPSPGEPEDRISPARETARGADPELAARFARYRATPGLTLEDADLLSGDRVTGDFFEAALAVHPDAGAVAAWIANDLRAAAGDRTLESLPFGGSALGRLAGLVAGGRVARPAGREVLAAMIDGGGDPEAIVRDRGLEAVSDPAALAPVIAGVLSARPDKVEEYRGGRHNLLGLFMGDVMRATGGTADPALVRRLLQEALGG
jgi:glutaminyl-tRNA synthetase